MFSRSAADTIWFPKNCDNVICALAEMNSSQLERSQKVFHIYYLSHSAHPSSAAKRSPDISRALMDFEH